MSKSFFVQEEFNVEIPDRQTHRQTLILLINRDQKLSPSQNTIFGHKYEDFISFPTQKTASKKLFSFKSYSNPSLPPTIPLLLLALLILEHFYCFDVIFELLTSLNVTKTILNLVESKILSNWTSCENFSMIGLFFVIL